ncbi:RHS repeat-associated core domain-containing protein [Stieleria bergensis]|uniref:RHS repeat-associated core domain-containing protein n=1 Tax=Stieleria bergensis TaxID=2528025 RepID=UPI003AF36B2D
MSIFDGGGVSRGSSQLSNRYTYTGREWDEDLDLYHYRARMYDPKSGRFCGRDPIGFNGSQWNLHEFVNSSPTSYLDPLGLQGHQVRRTCGSLRYEDNVRNPRFGCCNGKRYERAVSKCENGNIVNRSHGFQWCWREFDPGTLCRPLANKCGSHSFIMWGVLGSDGLPTQPNMIGPHDGTVPFDWNVPPKLDSLEGTFGIGWAGHLSGSRHSSLVDANHFVVVGTD